MVDKILEREYVIPLRKEFIKAPNYRKAKKSIRAIREFISRHMKVEEVKIGDSLNHLIWSRGRQNPVPKVKVKTRKIGDYAQVELVDKPYAETKEEKEEKEKKKEPKKKESKEMTQKEENKLVIEGKADEIIKKESGDDVRIEEKKVFEKTPEQEEKLRSQKIVKSSQKAHRQFKK